MPVERFAITAARLDPVPLTAAVVDAHGAAASRTGAAGAGAVASFVGLVRDQNGGRRVTRLDYEAYEPLALRAFAQIETEAVGALAVDGARPPSPDRHGRHRRGEHRDRRRVGASRRRVRGVPLRHRAGEADRADLEARVLRGRRRVDRRRGGRGGRRRGAGAGARGWHARDGAAVRPAARPRRHQRAGGRRPARRHHRRRVGRRRRSASGAGAVRRLAVGGAQPRIHAACRRRWPRPTRSRSCRRCPAAERPTHWTDQPRCSTNSRPSRPATRS